MAGRAGSAPMHVSQLCDQQYETYTSVLLLRARHDDPR